MCVRTWKIDSVFVGRRKIPWVIRSIILELEVMDLASDLSISLSFYVKSTCLLLSNFIYGDLWSDCKYSRNMRSIFWNFKSVDVPYREEIWIYFVNYFFILKQIFCCIAVDLMSLLFVQHLNSAISVLDYKSTCLKYFHFLG